MKKFVIIMIALVMVIISSISSLAGSSKTRQITGEVTAIDTKSKSVTVTKKTTEVTLSIEENTKIIMCVPKTEITDIRIGDKVTAKYKESTDKNTAKSITIKK